MTIDGMDAEISTCLTDKWKARINQGGLYNKKVGTQIRGLEKMAKNQSLPAHLQERDSKGKENLTLYEHHENSPSGDQGLAFQAHALQMTLFGPLHVRT